MQFYLSENEIKSNLFEKILNESFYKDKINKDVIKELCKVKTKREDEDEWTFTTLFSSAYEAASHSYVYYNMYGKLRSISYSELIENLPIIDFRLLASNLDKRSINKNFIEIFKINKSYSSELSELLRFGEHDDLICDYAEDLDWECILFHNSPLSCENIKKYFEFIYKNPLFLEDSRYTFDDDCLKFMVNAYVDIYYLESKSIYASIDFRNIFEKLFKTHKFSQDQLLLILNTFKKNETLKSDRSHHKFMVDSIVGKILETQNYSDYFLQKFKPNLFRGFKCSINRNAYFSEDFILQNCDNPKIIDWDSLSKNKQLLRGVYTDYFYKKFIDDINWKEFGYKVLVEFCKYDGDRFREFFIKFRNLIPKNEVIYFLECGLSEVGKYPFTASELIKHFSNFILESSLDKYRYIDDTFIKAAYKLKHKRLRLDKYLNETKLTKEKVKYYKKEIFDMMLDDNMLDLHTTKEIHKLLEEIKKEDTKNAN